MDKRAIAAAAALAALAAAPAQAHVTLQPNEVPAGGFTRLDVRVPNERDEAGTTKVQVQFPPGFASVSTEPKPGWRMKVKKRRAEVPVELHGEKSNEEIDSVTFTARGGTKIGPGEFLDFGLSLATPDKAGTSLTFKALQTYENGEVVRWIGAPDAEEPAPQVALLAAEEEGAKPLAAPTPAAADDDEDEDEGASTGLVVAALILGALGLLAGVAGLMTARRAREGAA
ncbi:MAG TPA: YcnI family protein [Solirubrobacteraceae bacterium]|nr:YcnI family protein [Solirubrobacteraceae bacterium]